MTASIKKMPSRGRLFKLFTDLGPYFRKLKSTEDSFFFDCLEVCVDATALPEEREFYGWWAMLYRVDTGFEYERFDGMYNKEGDWVVCKLKKEDKKQVDTAFELFLLKIKTLIEEDTGTSLCAREAILTEV
ncbi:sigma factor-binding protein Crl [Psychromonas sp. CD1]|uniref:sigma factor-binding protein Crl n=1 Tax=Psychromonas sp. CD1 TaxID=1979839 RepID=UPI000B9B5538|nr:sigma factor-binding protein Crl [Psychromonas sp. CD1]